MPHLRPLEARVLRTIRQHKLIAPGSTVVVAVSGGVDSLALLHSLHAIAPRIGCTLHVATLDHGLRGQAGAEDAAFVAAEAERLGLACKLGKRDVPALMQQWEMGTEAAARRARYEFLAEVAQAVGADTIAAAHHADDQAETVLMRLIRGAAMRGLAGMRLSAPLPYAPESGLRLIRPLLGLRRAQLERYAAALDLSPRHDATNDQVNTLRNTARHRLLTSFPQLARHLVQLSTLAQIDEDYFAQEIVRQVGDGFIHSDEGIVFDRVLLAGLPQAFQLRIIANALRRAAPEIEVPFVRIVACCEAIFGGKVGTIVQLEGGWRLQIDYTHAYLRRADTPQEAPLSYPLLASAAAVPVIVPGVTQPPGTAWKLRAQIVDESPQPAPRGAVLAVPVSAAIRLRTRRPGDRFAPLGMSGHSRKLKQWMIDHKLPQAVRDHVPLLDIDGQIAAVCWGETWTIADPFRVGGPKADVATHVHFWIEK